MKNYLLLWVLFPFCIWAQQIKPIDQNWPKGTSWSGDTNLFTYRYSELDSDKKYLEWRGQKKSSSHIYHPLTYGKRMKWELKFDIWVTKHQNRPNYLSVNLLTMKNEEDKDVIYTLYLDKERKLILMREIEGEGTELISSGTIFAKSLFFSFTVNVTFDVSKKKWDINYVSHDEEEDNVVLFSQSFSEKDAEKIKLTKEGLLRFKIYSPHKRIKSIKIKKIQFYGEGDESNDDDGDDEQEDPEEDFKFSDGKKINEKEYEINFNKKIETWSLSIFYYPQGELADFSFNKETQKGVTVKIEEPLSQPIQYFSFKNLKSDGQLIPIFYLMVQEDGSIVFIDKEDVPPEYFPDEEDPDEEQDVKKSFIFTEIMCDPKGAKGLPETEYIEIRSLSEETVNTKGLSFQYGKKNYSLPSFDVVSKQYAVLYKKGKKIDVDDQGVLIPMDKFPVLANKGKHIALWDGEELLDEVTYNTKMYGNKVLKGVSLERDEECDLKEERCWYASTDPKGGTPGAENSEREKEDVPDDDEVEGEDGEEENPVDTLIHAKEFIFTEIMYDPKGAKGLPETEYIEIRSLSEETINTKGLSFQYDKKKYSLPSFDVANGQYAVLYKRGEEIDIDDQGVLIPMDKFPILANKGKYIALLNGEELLDEITYSPKMYGDKELKGVSLERDEECDSKDDRCWYASSDPKGGTPGAKNSERKEVELPDDDEDDEQSLPITPQNDVVINEILFAPKNDGVEFLEIYNRSGKSVDLQGLAFAMIRQNKQIKTYYPMTHYSQLLLPNGYCVISKSTDKLVSHYPRTEIRNCIENKHPILPDGGGTIALINRKDQSIIDCVSYSPKWHDVQQSKTKGFSLERKNVDHSSNDPKNWGTALEEEGKATPGFVNSRITDESDMPTAIEDPIWDSKDNSIIIKYRTDLEGAFCNAYLFNVAGHLIERPAQQQLLGQYGQWEIKINQSKNILPGIYVLLIEIYHPTGKTERIKKVIYI